MTLASRAAGLSVAFLFWIAFVATQTTATLPSPRPIEEETCETAVTVSTAGTHTICSTTVTLPEGRYLALGRLRAFSMTAPTNPGIALFNVTSGECDRADMRQTANVAYTLQCTRDHPGGSLTATLAFSRNTGTTVFGVTGDPGFQQKITVALIQEPIATFPTFPPFPEETGPMTIEAFTGTAADSVDQILLVVGVGIVLMGCLLAAILVAAGLRR